MSLHEKCLQCLDNSTPEQIFKNLVRKDSDGNFYVPLKINLCDPDDTPVECGSDFTWEQLLRSLLVINDCNQCSVKVSLDAGSIELVCPDAPGDFKAEWINDFLRITFTDKTDGLGSHEVWEEVDGGGLSLVYTIPPGVQTYDYYTWQNANLNIRLRSKIGGTYSAFTHTENIVSPLVFQTDQTPLHQIIFIFFTITGAGKTIRIDWGDGNHNDYNSGANNDITHDYLATGNYFISFSGDVDYLWFWRYINDYSGFGDLSKWILPRYMLVLHISTHNFTGDWTNISIPSTFGVFHIENNLLTGSVSDWVFPVDNYEIRLSGNDDLAGSIDTWPVSADNGKAYYFITLGDTKITGNPATLALPYNLKWYAVYGTLMTADWTGWVSPVDCGFLQIGDNTAVTQTPNYTGDWTGFVFPTGFMASVGYRVDLTGYGFTGDLSGSNIPDVATNIYIYLGKNNFTKLPRGHYKQMYVFNAEENNCNTAEIDAFLAYVDGYFAGGVVPLVNCVYTINGTGMGIPSAAGLVSRASIIAKYVAEGKTCTINVNS